MNESPNREPTLTVSQEFSVLQRRRENAYLIAESDWSRIKRIVKEIIPPTSAYQIIASVCAGVAASSGFAIIPLALSSSPIPNWAWIVVTCALVASLLLSVAFFYFDSRQSRSTVRTVGSILQEMEEIEKACQPTPATSDLTIRSARYGAENGWNDVAERLRTKMVAGRLRVSATNEELGPDPLKDVVKRLEVVYTVGGKTYNKTVPENEVLSIPE